MEILAMKPMPHVLPQLQALPRASYFHWRLSIQSDMEEGKTNNNFVHIYRHVHPLQKVLLFTKFEIVFYSAVLSTVEFSSI